MFRRIPSLIFLGAILLCAFSAPAQDDQKSDQPDLRIAGPMSTKPLLVGIVRTMRQEKGLNVAVAANFASSDALDAVAHEKVNIGLMTKPLTGKDRAQYPDVDLVAIPIGMEVVALGVSGDLWDAGLHAITKETMRAVYERKVTNWKDAGGPDEKIVLFNFEQGHGVWEIMAEWLYGDNRKAPFPKVESVTSNEDARASVEFTPGSIVPIAASFVDNVRCHALGIDLPTNIARPVPADVSSGLYPIVRPLVAVVVGRPSLAVRAVTEFLTGPAGQEMVRKSGDLGADAVPKPSPDSPY